MSLCVLPATVLRCSPCTAVVWIVEQALDWTRLVSCRVWPRAEECGVRSAGDSSSEADEGHWRSANRFFRIAYTAHALSHSDNTDHAEGAASDHHRSAGAVWSGAASSAVMRHRKQLGAGKQAAEARDQRRWLQGKETRVRHGKCTGAELIRLLCR